MTFDSPPPTRPRTEPIVPMINVVFLLLIFFMISASIAQVPPFEVAPAASRTNPQTPASDSALWVSSAGELAFAGARDAAVWEVLAAQEPRRLTLHVDAAFPAFQLSSILSRLAAAGWVDVTLMTQPDFSR